MRREPLFIRFANGFVQPEEIVRSFLDVSTHEPSIKIAGEQLADLPDLSIFRKDFRKAVADIIDNGINNQFINYVNSYMKPSLLELVDADNRQQTGERRGIVLKAADAPWVEAIVCYNLSLYIKAFGLSELKQCPVCSKFFSNKGRYAKYCSDSCKKAGKA